MAVKAEVVAITTLSCASSTGSPDILCATISSRAAPTAMPTSACTSSVKDLTHFLLALSSCKPCCISNAPQLPLKVQQKIAKAYNARLMCTRSCGCACSYLVILSNLHLLMCLPSR